ncbi:MAG: site-specific DNA-methyltransferase [Candidatus Firestonebacteria bacterium]
MTKEEKFYKALQDVFIGAKIEGEGGFIKLMRIKSGYYEKINKKLQEDIEKSLEKIPSQKTRDEFKNELFDKLYSFFSRYFTESGSIYFNSTPFHNNIYEKVYTDEKDVVLFWKTQMLYYVKTDRIFKSMPVEFDEFKFYFDALKIESKKANEKRSLIFELEKVQEDKIIVFAVAYSERGTKTKQDETLKSLKKKSVAITEEQLERAFRVFEKQSEVDFFINKNAKAFLQEQFKLWSYQYFWDGSKEWSANRVNELQILKSIAFKIIDFISQFEDELVKIWNKPKFVRNSNYVITLDRILSACHCEERSDEAISLIKKILKAEGIKDQIKEWQELGIVDKNFSPSVIANEVKQSQNLKKEYEHLPIDTKYFKELELEILSLFDDLDNQLDGWLIKSENYQALNTILPKFKEKVQAIYIDPPFNLDSSDQFLYRTNYKDANWSTLLENRLKLAKDVLDKKGSIFVRCDYNGNWIVRCLMDDVFEKDNLRNEISIRKGNTQGILPNRFNPATESLFLYCKNKNYQTFNPLTKVKNRELKWIKMLSSKDNANKNWCFVNDVKFYSPNGYHWNQKQEKINKAYEDKKIIAVDIKGNLISRLSKNEIEKIDLKLERGMIYKLENIEMAIDSNWTDISGYSSTTGFQTENAEKLLDRVIKTGSNEKDIIFDFFLGSGTTTAVAHKLGRKWLGVEMGEHFYSVILPRMKKVLFYDKSGISKDVKEYKGGGFFKYYELEQYEETLNICKDTYKDSDLLTSPSKSPYQEYVFMKDEKMLKSLEIDYRNNKVKVDLTKLYPDIDIAETLSNLTGKWIKRVSDGEVEFTDGIKINIKDLDYKLIKPLIWWE